MVSIYGIHMECVLVPRDKINEKPKRCYLKYIIKIDSRIYEQRPEVGFHNKKSCSGKKSSSEIEGQKE